MEFESDEAKAKFNLRKHGVDFADAVRIFEGQGASHVLDETMDYGEDRLGGWAGQWNDPLRRVRRTRRSHSDHFRQKHNEA